jgi:hypothetical protein
MLIFPVKVQQQGTETFVQGPNQNKANLDVAKAENDVIFLTKKIKKTLHHTIQTQNL